SQDAATTGTTICLEPDSSNSIQEQCVARYVQQCSYKPLRQAGVFREVENKIQPIGLVSEYHEGESTGPNYDPEDMCQILSDVVKIVNYLVELCANTSCQYINDFDLWGEVNSHSFNPFSLANLEAPLFADKTVKGIEGLIIPFNNYGCPNAATPMHLDDYGLSTTSFHVAGATKVWTPIAPKDKLRFQKLVEVSLPSQFKKTAEVCDRKLSGAKLMFTAELLEKWQAKYLIVQQNPGDLLLLNGITYYQVHNPWFNIVRGINHNDDRQVPV
ncbi:unnamed protein product, partial [Allacma fusca]